MPLIQHIHAQLTNWFDTIVISADPKADYGFPPGEIIPDEIPNQGPLMAVYSILKALNQPTFVVAVDIPELPPSLVTALLTLARENLTSPAVVPVTPKGEYEPLFALYRPQILPAIEKALSENMRHVYGLFSEVQVTRYTLQPHEKLLNLNHPRDYRHYIASNH